MAEKRSKNRFRKRLSLRFGSVEATRLAFTEDISYEGLFIRTTNICQPGSEITIEITLADGSAVRMLGRVRWAKKVPPQLMNAIRKAGMGILITRFIAGEELYLKLIEEMHR